VKEVKRCPECDAKMVEYRHSLSRSLASCLHVFANRGGTIEFSQVNDEMTFNQKNNFQKLQYWGLITKIFDVDGRVEGLWSLTPGGYQFLQGRVSVSKSVWTYRNKVSRFDGDQVFITDLGYEPYRRREDYVADEKPRGPDGDQLPLL
jgi:hypothetical protein